MKATVIVNSRGAVKLPAKLRQALGFKADGHLIAETTSEGLLLRPVTTHPIEMYTDERIAEFAREEAEVAKVMAAHERKTRRRRA